MAMVLVLKVNDGGSNVVRSRSVGGGVVVVSVVLVVVVIVAMQRP